MVNPGCYPTAVIWGLWPLMRENVISPERLIADCKAGVPGAGRRTVITGLYAEASDSFRAYSIK